MIVEGHIRGLYNPRYLKGETKKGSTGNKGKAPPKKGKSVAPKRVREKPYIVLPSPKRRAVYRKEPKSLLSKIFQSKNSPRSRGRVPLTASPQKSPVDDSSSLSPLIRTRRHRGVVSGKRLCLDTTNDSDVNSDCYITNTETVSTDIEINPPDEEWKTNAVKYLQKWCGSAKIHCAAEDTDINSEKSQQIAPHAVDTIQGDGHCLFRAISKFITGNQKNHKLIRKAVVKWMLYKEHPPQLANYVTSVVKDEEPVISVEEYIEKNGISQNGWGGDKEIRAFATMLQISIYVSNILPGGRRWNKFPPLFHNNLTCMQQSDYRCYLYHSDSRNHYDLVIPNTN